MEDVKVILWGLGYIGSEAAKMILKKKGVKIAAVIDDDPIKAGRDLGEIIKIEKTGVIVCSDFNIALSSSCADVVIHTIDGNTENVISHIKEIAKNGLNCITTAGKVEYPNITNKEIYVDIDKIAREKNVTIIGTGINPGFALDTMIIWLSGYCRNIKSIKARRVIDITFYGESHIKKFGVGMNVDEFEYGVENNIIEVHSRLIQSVALIAKTLGIKIDEIKEIKEPIISNTFRKISNIVVEPGMVAGCYSTAYGMKNDKTIIILEQTHEIYPLCEASDAGEYIDIKGEPDIHLWVKPEMRENIGTAALAVNMIPQVVAANPGFKTMIDFPIPHAINNSFALQTEYYRRLNFIKK
jgi:4-hydroxy-tetrahydrodipicolinate reductase